MPRGSWDLPPTYSCHLCLIRPDDVPITFECSGKQGALLYLPFPASREETTALDDFSNWIVKNTDECFKVAKDLGYGVNRMEDIILVTGRRLARSWISVAFSEGLGRAGVSFRIEVFGEFGVRFKVEDVSRGDINPGPTGEVGFHKFEPKNMLRNYGHSRTSAFRRTNAFSFKGTASPAF